MDVQVNKRKYAKSPNNETSQRDDCHEIIVMRDRDTSKADTSRASFAHNTRSTIIKKTNSTISKLSSAAQRSSGKNFVNSQTSSANNSLVERLRKIKQKGYKRCRAPFLKDAQISDNAFVESVRILEKVCNSTPITRTQKYKVQPLGLVPFVSLERCDRKNQELQKNHRSTMHFSLDEDNEEEDMFADEKDEAENVVEFTQWEYKPAELSDETFCGFSPCQIQHSRDIVVRCSQLDKPDDGIGSWETAEVPALQGFTSMEIDTSERLAKFWEHRILNDSSKDSFGQEACFAQHAEDTKTIFNNVSDSAKIRASLSNEFSADTLEVQQKKAERFSSFNKLERAKSSEKRDYREFPELEPGKRISPKSAVNKPIGIGFATAGGRPIVISETALKKARSILSQESSSVDEESRDSSSLDDAPDSRKFSKLATRKQNPSKFATAGGRPITISAAALKKARNIYSQESSSVDEESRDSYSSIDASEWKNSSKPAKREPSACEFATAGGRLINVSGAALETAKKIYTKEISSITEESRDNYKSETSPPRRNSSKLAETRVPSDVGFATAGGRLIKISKAAIGKAKQAYSSLDDCEAGPSTSKTPQCRPEVTTKKSKTDFGFATARGNRLKISATALTKAKALLDQNDFSAKTKNEITKSNQSHDAESSSSKKAEHLATDLGYNIESLIFDDFVDLPEDDNDKVSRKRKIDEVDEETPLRGDALWKQKRGRYTSDLQARKLFIEDSSNDDDASTSKNKFGLATSTVREKYARTVSPEKSLISEEVVASAAALLEDEERADEAAVWKLGTSPSCVKKKTATVETVNESPKLISDRNAQRIINHSALVSSPSPNRKIVLERRNSSVDIQVESIPDDLAFETQFSTDDQYCPALDKFIDETMKIMEARLAMTRKQDETIRAKRRTKPQHCDGFLYKLRISNRDSRISWKDLTKGAVPAPRQMSDNSHDSDVLSVTANSAESFSFSCADLFGLHRAGINAEGIKVGDDAFLILDEKNRAGVREFERAFLASPGLDPSLVCTGWVRNHYRWIVWKLASMDRVNFDRKCLPRMLTPDRVMFELRYRYDREIYRTQWPPLRRILERNEDASARIVLCVASIAEENVNTPVRGSSTPVSRAGNLYKMKLTDGWYCIDACIDAAMLNCIKSGKVREGTKLMTIGAKTMNLDQGCSALDIPADVSLKIHTNSTRRVRWDSKLDYYHRNRGPMLLSLKSIKPNGGEICKLVVAVARLYPILYREKMPDGQFVFRNARCDEEAALAHETRHQSKMEEIYSNARKEFQNGLASKTGMLSSYREMEEEIRQSISLKLQECLPPPRDVTPVMKLRIAEGETSAMLTVWSNDRDTMEMFVEGSTLAIYNSFASRQRLNELHITASRSSFVKREATRRIVYPERIFTPLADISEPGFYPVYGEFDTIGVVASIGPAPHGMKNFETVNLSCPRQSDAAASTFLSILFWQGVSTHGYSKILTVGSLVACSNLEWRRNTVKSIPTAYCTERSVFSKNPRQNHLGKAFETLRGQIQERFAYAAACAAIIEEEIAKKSALRTPGKGTPYRPATSNTLTPGWTPRDSRNSSSVNSTPGTVASRKESAKRRMQRLEAYGEAPKLPSIVITNSSRLSDYRSPVTPVTKS